MAFTLDPQVAVAMEPLSALATGMSRPEVGDVASRRLTMEAGQVFMETRRVIPSDVMRTDLRLAQMTAPPSGCAGIQKMVRVPVRPWCIFTEAG